MLFKMGFPGGSESKEFACKAGDQSLMPGSGRSPEVGNDNPLQYSCLEISMDRETWRATVRGVTGPHDVATKQQQHEGN